MALSIIVIPGDGVTQQFSVPFSLGYLENPGFVTCRVGDEVDGTGAPLYRSISFLSDEVVLVSGTAAGVGVPVRFERTVPRDTLLVNYEDGAIINEENMNTSQLQLIMLVQEIADGRFSQFQTNVDMALNRFTNMGDPIDAQDGATKAYVDTRYGSNLENLNAAIAARDAAAGYAVTSGNNANNASASATQAQNARNEAAAFAASINPEQFATAAQGAKADLIPALDPDKPGELLSSWYDGTLHRTGTLTGQFLKETGASIIKAADRMFVGDAVKHDGSNVNSQPDWLTTYLFSKGRTSGFQQVTQFASLTTNNNMSANAGLFAGKTDILGINGANAIGTIGVGVVNHTGSDYRGAWGVYAEAFKEAGTVGNAIAVEVDTINFATPVGIDPFVQDQNMVVGMQIANGGEFPTATDATAAVNIQANPKKYLLGINFAANSILGTDGLSGVAPAINMVTGHSIDYYYGAGLRSWALFASAGANGDYNFVPSGSGAVSAPKLKETVGDQYVAYTPTVTTLGGTGGVFANTGRYRALGKTAFLDIEVVVTTAPTGASALVVTLPAGVVPKRAGILIGADVTLNGNPAKLILTAGSSTAQIFSLTTPQAFIGSTGMHLVFTGTFERQ